MEVGGKGGIQGWLEQTVERGSLGEKTADGTPRSPFNRAYSGKNEERESLREILSMKKKGRSSRIKTANGNSRLRLAVSFVSSAETIRKGSRRKTNESPEASNARVATSNNSEHMRKGFQGGREKKRASRKTYLLIDSHQPDTKGNRRSRWRREKSKGTTGGSGKEGKKSSIALSHLDSRQLKGSNADRSDEKGTWAQRVGGFTPKANAKHRTKTYFTLRRGK